MTYIFQDLKIEPNFIRIKLQIHSLQHYNTKILFKFFISQFLDILNESRFTNKENDYE